MLIAIPFEILGAEEILSQTPKAHRRHLHDYSTHRQTPWTDNDSSLPIAALGSTVRVSTDGRMDTTEYIISLHHGR